ncbi:MAG: metallophosphoesterase, partial [Spirochaetota bacterium]|nr:metallophosphoesterase [Spirochaetota bacterium]
DGIIILGVLISIPPIFLLIIFFIDYIKGKNHKIVFDINKRKFLKRAAIASTVLGAPLTYHIYSERENVEIVKMGISDKSLPQAFNGFRIVQISDIHSSFYIREKYLNHVVEEINKLNGDILVLTGDYITHLGDKKHFPEFIRSFSKLNNSYKKYAVLGNHDFWTDHRFVESSLNELGIKVLRNESSKIIKNDETIYLAGIDDIIVNRQDIKKATSNVILSEFSILLCHSPDFIYDAVKYNFNIMLSGHTHGGQFQLPFIGPLIIPSRFGRKFGQGLHKVENTHLYVNRGIGVISPPVRFLCRPEITEITLKKEV